MTLQVHMFTDGNWLAVCLADIYALGSYNEQN